MTTPTSTAPRLVAELNDLLQLDHDAVAAYTVSIDALKNPRYRQAVERFRGDHERHIAELTRLIEERGGTPVEMPHVPTGVFKLAMQQAGTLAGGDRSVLLAFKANERQVRDKYRRMAEASEDLEAADVLSRGADDEAKHYGWVVTSLEELGIPADSMLGRAEGAFEAANARMVDATERVERGVMTMTEGAKRLAKRPEAGMIAAVAAVGLGFLASRLMRRDH